MKSAVAGFVLMKIAFRFFTSPADDREYSAPFAVQ
jgi:hypothetical protein